MDDGAEKLKCSSCGNVGLDESDGFYYCSVCGAQAVDIILTDVADEDLGHPDGTRGIYSALFKRSTQRPHTVQVDTTNQAWVRFMQEEVDETEKREYSHGMEPMEPEDFGPRADGRLSYEDYYNEVRFRYVMGMQWMIQLQCEALVDKFNASPLICGVAGTLWFRYLSSLKVFKEGWADEVLLESETQIEGDQKKLSPIIVSGDPKDCRLFHRNEPLNSYGQRAVSIWFKYLRKRIPLFHSLAISFLACHVAREGILPTDIVKWSLEGKLPFFDAHREIENRFERNSAACPISSNRMFKPSQTVPVQNLEFTAARIAESLGLHLPPVNFYKIASRYLKKLSLPLEKILPHALRIYEWSMPPDLWLSTNEFRLPTRICVMSILLVAIRILYNINGFGAWEKSLSSRKCSDFISHHTCTLDFMSCSEMEDDGKEFPASPLHKVDGSGENFIKNPSHTQKPGLGLTELLLHHLEATYAKNVDTYEFSKDLPSYLQYCNDVLFAGAGPSHTDYQMEEEMIDKLWDFYQNEQEDEAAEEPQMDTSSVSKPKRSRNGVQCDTNLSHTKKNREGWHDSPSTSSGGCYPDDPEYGQQPSTDDDQMRDDSEEHQDLGCSSEDSEKTNKEKAIRRLKVDMEENRFRYIPPRVVLKRFDYLHYTRKTDNGSWTYVAHADYYILLRCCAKVVQVDIRLMHLGVLSFERRLAWLEGRIGKCLGCIPSSITCRFCLEQ